MVKRRNHEVPKGLLRNWIGRNGSKEGLHFVDLSDGRLRFEEGKNANFAITDYLYVPERENGERDDALEDWFSVDEDGLARFARSAGNGSFGALSEKVVNQAVRASIALGHRSAYSMYMTMLALGLINGSGHSTAVDNVLSSIGRKFQSFRNWDFVILYDLPVPLLISERPFLDFTPREASMVMMPLGPRALMLGSPPNATRSEMQIGFQKAEAFHQRIAEMYNQACIEMARQWLVAETSAQLTAILTDLTPDKVISRRKTDLTIVEAREVMITGSG